MQSQRFISLEQNINLPDRLFSGFIMGLYGINKGVYNTIDVWFYEKGMDNLIMRRKTIVDFLNIFLESANFKEKRVKFGNGGLSEKLNDYWESNVLKKTYMVK